MKEVEKSVDSRLWHACAGGMTQMALPNSKVCYFPQGHAEHTLTNVDFARMPRVPPYILCRVIDVKFLADIETDEVYARIMLSPLGNNINHDNFDDERNLGETHTGFEASDKPNSFAKTLTQSDANNGGGFSVPRYCAETIFPKLDYTADPPVQTVVAKDVHGEIWKFRHIYRGTPRRHLLTTGWSTFVNLKKLVAGDSIVFMRAENGDLCVGIRRAKRGGIGGPNSTSGWSSSFFRETGNKLIQNGRNVSCGRGKVRPEDVIEATSLAANGQPFEVTYYPRASTPEFVVKASSLNAASCVRWSVGMRFKMAFETEDSSRISWFMGTVSAVQVVDPYFWPNSPWRLLQVDWDEPDLLQNVKRVSPWLVELVSNMPLIHLSPFSPHRKKLRIPQSPDLPKDNFALPQSFSVNPQTPSSYFPAGIQGARHAQFQIPFSDLNLTHKLQLNLFPKQFDSPEDSVDVINGNNDDISCLLTIGNPSYKLDKTEDNVKTPIFLLFGQPIHIDQQSSQVNHSSAEENANTIPWDHVVQDELVSGHHCEVFLESEDVGRTLDLSVIGSYEDLDKTLASWFGIEWFNDMSCVIYNDSEGVVKRIGDEPFSEFVLKAKRLTILMDVCSRDDGRKLLTMVGGAGHMLESSKQTGHASIFA